MESEMAKMEGRTLKHEREPTTIFKNANRPVTLKFEDVDYTVKIKQQKGLILIKSNNKCEEKRILKGISGIVLPGEMLAILGPSGSGKTTLLTALGGRLSGCISGTISYNGKPFSNKMKRNIGFVTQEDILHPHLTVTETLVYTALLRLPNSLSKADKIAQAEAVISQLGLAQCKNNMIGEPFLRGVSGGERKRVSIGQEMLINPSFLLLDEPTSGLDSTTAQKIVSLLWELTKGGRTIVMTVHQPASKLFYMFHKVLLLSEGNPLYFGKAEDVLDYFSSVGYAPSMVMNPSDFMLDLANGISNDEYLQEDQTVVKQKLVSAYKKSIDQDLKAKLHEHGDIQDMTNCKQLPLRWTTTWWQQFSVLFQRGLKERKHESFSGLKIAQVLVVAFLAGLVWWQSKNLQDQIGFLFFGVEFWGFFPLYQAVFKIPQERMTLSKERSSGMYRLSSYFMAQTICDLHMELVLPTIFAIITYSMVGLKPTATHFIFYLQILLLTVLVSQGLGLALGAVIKNQKSAAILGSVMMLSFLVAGGFFVHNVPQFISWIKYTSICWYTYKLMLGSQYKIGETYHCVDNPGDCLVENFANDKNCGLGGQVMSVVALLIMLIGYRVIAYVALMRVGVTQK